MTPRARNKQPWSPVEDAALMRAVDEGKQAYEHGSLREMWVALARQFGRSTLALKARLQLLSRWQ